MIQSNIASGKIKKFKFFVTKTESLKVKLIKLATAPPKIIDPIFTCRARNIEIQPEIPNDKAF